MKYKVNKNRLNKSILNSGLTMTEISEKAKISRQTIYRVLSTDTKVMGYTLGRLSKVLNTEVDELIEE